ncbi:acyl dehydratase [Planifilum fimeticola]|jgi:acyl dehydratase|uniref:Acyl dehydratase n=1 Tax=Planifilum fimeticola TaxID=201975 RepID=A0A2T0LFM0_9BACL|nr:MaoC/PaaZ C-terminal domain-containing protein [Planifilum fimeticola]PRX41014.1 acyl dehydratase [Planifilum fimeticola]
MTTKAPISWKPGDELPSITLPPVTRLDLIKYAGASGDFNPIHTIDEEAARAGLSGVIAHGMLTMAVMGRLFSPYLEHGFIKGFQTRFTGMVLVGDVLTVGGKVLGVESAEQGDLYSFDVFTRNQKGETVASGKVEFLVYRD